MIGGFLPLSGGEVCAWMLFKTATAELQNLGWSWWAPKIDH